MPRSALAAALLLLVGTPALAAAQGGGRSQTVTARDESPASALPKGERKLICRGGSIDAGWILVDDVKDPKSCGGDNPAVLNTFNVWVLEKFEGRPVGTQMDVCALTPIPKGWVLVDIFRDKTTCGHPQDSWGANVKRIRRAG